MTLRSKNIFPLLITDRLDRNTRWALRTLQEVKVKSYFWWPNVLNWLESISWLTGRVRFGIRSDFLMPVIFIVYCFRITAPILCKPLASRANTSLALLICKIFHSHSSVSERGSCFRSCMNHLHSLNTNVTGLADFWIWFGFIWNHGAGGSNPGRHTNYFDKVSRRFHWSVQETYGILLRLDHVTF